MSTALLLRIVLAAQLALGALLAWALLPAPLHWLALPLAPLLPVAGTALVLGFEFIVSALIDPQRPAAAPGGPRTPARALRLWEGETRASLRAFTWRQPFGAGFPEPPLQHDPARPALLLVHGYVCNRAVWRPLLDSGLFAHCNVATVDLAPVFGPIDRYAAQIDAAVARLRAATGAARVTLVGHSMGGLAARTWLRDHGDAAVERVITLGSPHHGTAFGRLGHGANARQMARGSRWLAALAAGESAALRRRFVCIGTADDNLVIPRSSPLLAGAEQHLLDGVGHLALIEDPRAWRLIAAAIGPADAATHEAAAAAPDAAAAA